MTTCSMQTIRATRTRKPAIDWRHDLPKEWRRLEVERFRDYEMAAERMVGRDEDERPCYCNSRVVVMETRSDDEEEFYQIVA